MTDYELEQRLRAWYRDEIGYSEAAPDALRDVVMEVGSTRARFDTRSLALLAAAAMLAAAAIAGTIAVGSGLIRLPWLDREVVPPVTAVGWTATGSLVEARYMHTATVLADGTVLVAGGAQNSQSGFPPMTSAELYDPSSGTWRAAGAMGVPRYMHSATLLADGMVLVAGGMDENGSPLASAELYDPSTGVWSETGPMIEARAGHTATLLTDGTVLVAGGSGNTAETFDRTTGTWTATEVMVTTRNLQTATLLSDGTVLLAGGDVASRPSDDPTPPSAELYDPDNRSWTATGEMVVTRVGHEAVLLPNGQVLVAGGDVYRNTDDTRGVPLASAELYDPASRQWSATASMHAARDVFSASPLPDGLVLAVGGFELKGGAGLSSAEVYDPVARTWTLTPPLTEKRAWHEAVLLSDGRVLVVGGLKGPIVDAELASTELYGEPRD